MNITSNTPKILVIGSSSIDLVLSTDRHPEVNDVVLAKRTETFFGGKGANQAVGTARLGASVYFIGSVGMDPKGQQILRYLKDEGINVGFVYESENCSTGNAYVAAVDGQHTIIVSPAANYDLSTKHIKSAEKLFATADIVLLQLEIPMEVVEYSVAMAKKYGKQVILYASPAKKLSQQIIDDVTYIVVKSTNITSVFGDMPKEEILRANPNKLFVMDDANSTIFYDGEVIKYHKLKVSNHPNKMGMGDGFISGFAVAICHNNTIQDAVLFGNSIASKVAEKTGSQTNLPYLRDILSHKM